MRKAAHPVPEHYTTFQKGDKVILTSRYPRISTTVAPVWGSRMGYIVGEVEKVINNDHDKSKHLCQVNWPIGVGLSDLPNTVLDLATPAHIYVHRKWDDSRKILPAVGVYILARENGQFYLGYLDYNEKPDPREPYHIMFSQQPLPEEFNSEFTALTYFVSAEDFVTFSSHSPYAALDIFRKENGFAEHNAFVTLDPTSLFKFSGVTDAMKSIPEGETRDGVILFTTPKHLYDMADLGSPGDRGPDEVDESLEAVQSTFPEARDI